MIELANVYLSNGKFAINDVSFFVAEHQYAVLMGKTGCGKSTLLEAICGLKSVDSGRIHLKGKEVTTLRPSARGVGYVPQDGALFTSMTVLENLSFSLQIRKESKQTIKDRIDELSALLGLRHLLDRYPHALSGGEAQWVALGRALAFHPSILCLDEPLSALDDETRVEMYHLLKSVQTKTGVTVLHVTHNQSEADNLADIVLRMHDGKISVQE